MYDNKGEGEGERGAAKHHDWSGEEGKGGQSRWEDAIKVVKGP